MYRDARDLLDTHVRRLDRELDRRGVLAPEVRPDYVFRTLLIVHGPVLGQPPDAIPGTRPKWNELVEGPHPLARQPDHVASISLCVRGFACFAIFGCQGVQR